MKNLPLYISLLLLITCAKEDSQAPNTPPTQIVKQYALTASAGEGGSVSGGGTFASGTQVSLTATPNSGYSFSGWSNGSTANPLNVTLNSNTTITANFEVLINSYTLTVLSSEGGSVTGGGEYEEGTEVTISATPEEGYEFTGWSDGESSQSRVVTINSDISLSAEFYIKLYNYERYSAINETTSSFLRQKYFYRYLSKDEYMSLHWSSVGPNGETLNCCSNPGTFYSFRVHGSHDTWGDFNNDGKLDYFGSSWKSYQNGPYGNENSEYIFISDYFTESNRTYKTLMSEYINWSAPTSIADFDNDGYMDVWVSQFNRHNNYTSLNHGPEHPNYGVSVEPGKGAIVFFGPNNEMTEIQVGPFLDSHSSTTGDIDNDGDVDMILFPVNNPGEVSPSPKILINNGARNFQTIELLKNHNDFFAEYPYAWEALNFNVFDLDGDGNLDIFGSDKLNEFHRREIDPYWDGQDDSQKGFHNNNKPWILWGTNDVQYDSENLITLDKNIYRADEILIDELPHFRNNNSLGSGFTDFDNDGDIDIILLSTVGYRNYELTLYENKGNRIFEDVTQQKIEGYYNMDPEKYGEFYFIAMIDKDYDGDFDIVPYGAGNSFGAQFITNLYWENTGGQFVRREYNYD